MENVKFVRSIENGNEMNLYFKICDKLADFVRKNTCYTERGLSLYLDKHNEYCYIIRRSDNYEAIQKDLVETIERISNEKDDAYFYNHLITDNGYPRSPREIHALMRTEYGLADIDEAENDEESDNKDLDIEWWTAHFFIQFGNLLFDKVDVGNDMIHTAASKSEITSLLDMIKSIDKIVIVDDVRKYGPEDIKKLQEELDSTEDDTEDDD
ncbi:hypothetical protein SAMN05216390_10923 [Lachnospiraceae bacterium KH1T2]|nr:hypothetical protein SAMN05216390_10923 [Lachnospiraceae bacterium KH1T2]